MNIIPVLLRTQQQDRNSSIYTRTQIPLTLAFVITIYKSQGLTLDKAVINLATKTINSTLIYVALSRVYYITSLALEGCIAYNRFLKDTTLYIKMRVNDAADRQGLPIPYTLKGSYKPIPSRRRPITEEVEAEPVTEVEDTMDFLTAESLAK